MNKTPAVRFIGFVEDWEQRKLGDVLVLLKDGTHGTHKDAESGPLLLSAKNIKNGTIQWDESDRRISEDEYNNIHSNFKLQKGDVLLTIVGSIGETAILSQSKGVTFQRSVAFLRPSDKISSEFLYSEIQGQKFQKALNVRKSTSAQPGIYLGDLGTIPIEFPTSDEEQMQIGSYFQNLDNLITLHQRKYEKLKNIKKSMLEKMFPKNGSNVPEIRFKGFTDAWEQRKVSDLAEKTYGGGTPTTSNEAYWNGDIPWIQSSDVVDGKLLGVEPRKWITQDGLNNSVAQLIPGNSIAIITRVGVGKLAFMPYSYATSQDFLSLSKLNAEPLFTVYACYKKLQSELNAVQGTSIKGITKDELLAKNIMVPRYAEQQQIGAFFKQLDNLITLHHRKLEKLEQIKQAMLHKMFV